MFMVLWLATVLSPMASADGGYDESWSRQFVNAIGSTVYALAWPSATYRSVSLEGLDRRRNGADIKIRLDGISAFDDSSLWVDVVISVRDGEISDIRWGSHNAFWVPPGETVKALGVVLAELNREYSAAPSYASVDAAQVRHVVCIQNTVPGQFKFQYRWANSDQWQSVTLDRDEHQWHANTVEQRFYVRFDGDGRDGYQEKDYYLVTYPNRKACEGAKTYNAFLEGSRFDLTGVN